MSGAAQPASSIRCLISGTAAAASGTFTVTRTSSDPASASSMHCARRRRRIGRVGHRHRLHDDRRAAADEDAANFDADGLVKPREAVIRIHDTAPVQTRNSRFVPRFPPVPNQHAANVIGPRHREVQRVVVLGAVHDAVEKPGDGRLRGARNDRGVRGRLPARHPPEHGGIAVRGSQVFNRTEILSKDEQDGRERGQQPTARAARRASGRHSRTAPRAARTRRGFPA